MINDEGMPDLGVQKWLRALPAGLAPVRAQMDQDGSFLVRSLGGNLDMRIPKLRRRKPISVRRCCERWS